MGGPRSFPPGVVVEVKALACELPATLGVPLSRLHIPDIRAEAIARGLVASISETTIWRWLSEDAIKPWQHRSWIFPRDPDFERKAGVVLDLYHRTFEGQPLRANEYVLSADEKTSIQARCRCHPTLPPAQARAMRVEHEYDRGGALQYLAAWDCHHAKLFGRCEPHTGIAASHDNPALCQGAARLLDRRQQFQPSGRDGHPPRARPFPKRAADPLAPACFLAQPGGDLLRDCPAQSPDPQ